MVLVDITLIQKASRDGDRLGVSRWVSERARSCENQRSSLQFKAP